MCRTQFELERAIAKERARLLLLAPKDQPNGEYAAPVFGAGAVDSPVMLVGEAPGAEETKQAVPFVGKAGKQLDALLQMTGIPRVDLYVTNAVKYRPVVRGERSTRNRTPSRKEIEASLPLLQEEIRSIRPRVIVTLGNTPLLALLLLLGIEAQTVGAVHGKTLPVKWEGWAVTLFPLYHPASGIYNPALVPVMERDAEKLREHLVKAEKIVFSTTTGMV